VVALEATKNGGRNQSKLTTPDALVARNVLKPVLSAFYEWFEDRPIIVNPSNCSACLEYKSSCPDGSINVKEK